MENSCGGRGSESVGRNASYRVPDRSSETPCWLPAPGGPFPASRGLRPSPRELCRLAPPYTASHIVVLRCPATDLIYLSLYHAAWQRRMLLQGTRGTAARAVRARRPFAIR